MLKGKRSGGACVAVLGANMGSASLCGRGQCSIRRDAAGPVRSGGATGAAGPRCRSAPVDPARGPGRAGGSQRMLR